MCICSFLSLNCGMSQTKMLHKFVKDTFVLPSINVIKNFNMYQKNSVYLKPFHLNSFLLLTSTSITNITSHNQNSLKNSLNNQREKLSSLTRMEAYLHSMLTKPLLTSNNMNYLRNNLIYLNQVYTFQYNQIKFENPECSLPLKRFIVLLLTTLNPRKLKFR